VIVLAAFILHGERAVMRVDVPHGIYWYDKGKKWKKARIPPYVWVEPGLVLADDAAVRMYVTRQLPWNPPEKGPPAPVPITEGFLGLRLPRQHDKGRRVPPRVRRSPAEAADLQYHGHYGPD